MVESIKVLPIGSQVSVGYADTLIEAKVVAIGIYPHQVMYQCVWWDGSTRKSEWLHDNEVKLSEVDTGHRTSIGFIH